MTNALFCLLGIIASILVECRTHSNLQALATSQNIPSGILLHIGNFELFGLTFGSPAIACTS